MRTRSLLTAVVAATCFAAAPAGPPGPAELPPAEILPPSSGTLPTNEEFAALLRSDPIRAFEVSLQRYRAEVRKYTCTMEKRERIGGTLQPAEVVRAAFRDDPFSVFMRWDGEPRYRFPYCSLYVRGENGGKTKALVRTRIGTLTLDTEPDSASSRTAARYSIEDFGFHNNTLRTYRAWKAARDRGRFHFEFLKTGPVPECGGRVCHVVRRACDPPEIDTFSLSETEPRDPGKYTHDVFATVTLMFDAETWLQVGSVQTDAKGELVGSYYFRDVDLNPRFAPDQFTPAALRK